MSYKKSLQTYIFSFLLPIKHENIFAKISSFFYFQITLWLLATDAQRLIYETKIKHSSKKQKKENNRKNLK